MKILTYPNKLLTGQAEPVTCVDKHIRAFIDRMFITMYRARGVGLAAPQVGVMEQITVINLGWRPQVLINPVLVELEDNGYVEKNESCLSLPGLTVSVKRALHISVKSLNRHGLEQNFETWGLHARCVQHEVDHLHGVLINNKGGLI